MSSAYKLWVAVRSYNLQFDYDENILHLQIGTIEITHNFLQRADTGTEEIKFCKLIFDYRISSEFGNVKC